MTRSANPQPENIRSANLPTSKQPGKIPWTPVLVGLLLLMLTLPIVGLAFYASGYVQGAEFCPDDFTRREFSYNKLPVLGWTLSGIEYDNVTGELEETLISDDFVTPPATSQSGPASNKRWHLYQDSSVPDSHDCDARFLVDYLSFHDEDDTNGRTSYWVNWNERFPKSAKVFWPVVADLARHEMYLGIPEVMRCGIAVSKDQPKLFQARLLKLSSQLWQQLGQNDVDQKRFQRAATRLLRAQAIKSSEEVTSLLQQIKPQVADFAALESDVNQQAADLLKAIETKLAKKPITPAKSDQSDRVEDTMMAETPEP